MCSSDLSGKRLGRQAIHSCFRFYVWLLERLCGCRFDLRALDELARQSGPMIIVANHPFAAGRSAARFAPA